MVGQGGSTFDRGMGGIKTNALCEAECDKRGSCEFYVYQSSNKWCYLWKGASCSPVSYRSYRIKQKVCDAPTGNIEYLLLW